VNGEALGEAIGRVHHAIERMGLTRVVCSGLVYVGGGLVRHKGLLVVAVIAGGVWIMMRSGGGLGIDSLWHSLAVKPDTGPQDQGRIFYGSCVFPLATASPPCSVTVREEVRVYVPNADGNYSPDDWRVAHAGVSADFYGMSLKPEQADYYARVRIFGVVSAPNFGLIGVNRLKQDDD
jgi:hypothetical protein